MREIWRDGDGFKCEGNVVKDGKCMEFSLSGPTEKIEQKSDCKLNRQDRQILKNVKQEKFQECVKKCRTDYNYRRIIRVHHLRHLGKQEIQKALKSKASARSFSLGLVSLETDFDLFQIDPFRRRRIFSIWKEDMHILDEVFGEEWDLLKDDHSFFFVTQFVVSITSHNNIKVMVKTACCQRPPPATNIRQFVVNLFPV